MSVMLCYVCYVCNATCGVMSVKMSFVSVTPVRLFMSVIVCININTYVCCT